MCCLEQQETSLHTCSCSIFKDNVDKSVIDSEIAQVEKEGGSITQRYDSSIMRGFAARLPEAKAQSYASLTEGGKHDHM